MQKPVIHLVAATLILCGCTSQDESPVVGGHDAENRLTEIVIKPFIVWGGIDVPEDRAFANVNDFIILSHDKVVLSDIVAHEILFFNKKGALVRRIGRYGKGPVEFNQPRKLGQVGDNIAIWDVLNGRIQLLSGNGEYLSSSNAGLVWIGETDFFKDGGFVHAGQGYQFDSLLVVYDENGNKLRSIGALASPASTQMDMRETKRYAKRREIAPKLKNQVLLCITSDNNILAAHCALPVVKKFSREGRVIFTGELDAPEFKAIVETFFLKNQNAPSNGSFGLSYWRDISPDPWGGAYLLLTDSENLIIYHLNASGDLCKKLLGPAGDFKKIEFDESELWAYNQSNMSFYGFKLPQY